MKFPPLLFLLCLVNLINFHRVNCNYDSTTSTTSSTNVDSIEVTAQGDELFVSSSTEVKSSESTQIYATGKDGQVTSTLAPSSTISVAAVYEELLSGQSFESTDSSREAPPNQETTAHDQDISTSASGRGQGGSSGSAGSAREICDFCLYEGEGNFTSYGYPLPYRPDLNCSYRIQRLEVDIGEVCELELVFHDFDVQISSVAPSDTSASNDCREDYLEVHGRRFCGSGWRGRTELVPFPADHKEVTFHFRSNERAAGRGFWVEVRRRPASCFGRNAVKLCEERISDPEAHLTSPRFPGDYPNNADCQYYIRKSSRDVCALELTFLHFDVEPVNGCFYDFLELDGQKICGSFLTNTKKVLKFDEDQKVLNFHTDKQVARTGFHVRIRQLDNCDGDTDLLLPAPPSCNVCSREPTGTLVSYGYPANYRHHLLCTYTIDKPSPEYCAVELHFRDFNVVPSRDCSRDFLQISGQRFCGTTLHSARKIIPFGTEDSLTFVFQTDDNLASKGFLIDFKQLTCSKELPGHDLRDINQVTQVTQSDQDVLTQQRQQSAALPAHVTPHAPAHHEAHACDYIYSDKVFHIRSEKSDSGPISGHYPASADCTYFVRRNSTRVCYLELSFVKFDVEASAQCQFDYLEINNVRLCGSLAKETTRTYIFDEKEKLIKFRSDASTSRAGFLIKVEQLECDGDVIIRTPSPLPLTSESPLLITESPLMRHHYHGRINIPPVTKSCSQFYSSLEFELKSPSYPRPYPQDVECSYYIKKLNQNVCRLEVNYEDFQLQHPDENNYCKWDYLDFNGIRMCGSLSSGTVRHYYFPEHEFKVRFASDSLTTAGDKNFKITVRQLECPPSLSNSVGSALDVPPGLASAVNERASGSSVYSGNSGTSGSKAADRNVQPFEPTVQGRQPSCDQMFSSVTFELKSPRYPDSYPMDTSCTFTVVKAAGRTDPICQLEVQFAELSIDGEQDICGSDHLEFGPYGRICGKLPPETIKFFPFDGSTFTMNFRAGHRHHRSSGTARYHLRVRQRECVDESSLPSNHGQGSKVAKAPPSYSSQVLEPSGQSCNQVLRDIDFELRSPHYPSAYPDNVDCTFMVRRANVRICQIELKFVEFDLEEGGHCEYDFLLLDRKRLCGKIKSNSVMTFEFPEPEKPIIFRSDGARARRGFLISGTQKECPDQLVPANYPANYAANEQPLAVAPSICELCFADVAGQVKSYGWPNSYPPNLNCKYKFTGLPGYCSVEIKFDEFRLEPMDTTGECSADFVELDKVRYCGNQLSGATKTLPLKGHPADAGLRFHSNGHASFAGFKATYYQIPCLAAMNVMQRTPTGGPLPAESGPTNDHHHITSGSSHSMPTLVAPSDPHDHPPAYGTYGSGYGSSLSSRGVATGLSHSITVLDTPPAGGSRVPCDLVVYDSYFELFSPGYPYTYPSNSDCLYSVRQLSERICRLRLTFVEFDLESSPSCERDSLTIDGQPLCGVITNGTTKEYDFTSYKMALRFRSDARGSRKGFFVKGHQVEGDQCHQAHHGVSSNHFKSGLYIGGGTGVGSGVHVEPAEGSSQQRHSFHAPEAPSAATHHVVPPPWTPPSASSYPPGVTPARPYSVSGTIVQLPETRMDFGPSRDTSSPNHRPAPPTQFQYPGSYPSPPCDQVVNETFFDLRSPNYPLRYPPGSRCVFVIKKESPKVCHLDILFGAFDVGDLICDHGDHLSVDGERFCGTLPRERMQTFRFDGHEVRITFVGTAGRGHGFQLRGRQVECGRFHARAFHSRAMDEVGGDNNRTSTVGPDIVVSNNHKNVQSTSLLRDAHFRSSMIMDGLSRSVSNVQPASPIPYCDQAHSGAHFPLVSPNHPHDYPTSLYCRYAIRRQSTSACALDVKFKNFELEESDKCSKDYLEIDSGKICGLLTPGHERRYFYFPGENEKVFTFRTDERGSRSGFSIEVTQITNCNPAVAQTASAGPAVNCDVKKSDVRGHISSVGYPNRYEDLSKCTFHVTAANSNYCSVRLLLRDVDISRSPACDKDYLYINGERICGHDLPQREIVLPFFSSNREIMFNFITDALDGRRGFYVEYVQELCPKANPDSSHGISYSVAGSEAKSPSSNAGHSSGASGSFEYPSNYVARAQLEQIVETQVRVVDSKDGLFAQVSNVQPNNSTH